MKQYILLIFAGLAIYLASCGQGGNSIHGTIADAQNLSVYFDKVNPITSTNSVIAKGQTDIKGNFSILMETVPTEGIYRIRLGAKSVYMVLNGQESNIQIDGSLADITSFNYNISGSNLSSEYALKMRELVTGSVKLEELSKWVVQEAHPLLGMLVATQRFLDVSFAPIHVEVGKRLLENYEQHESAQEYIVFANGMMREYTRQQSLARVKVGELAPEIALPDVNGAERKLSDLRGNVVLLDFWASWCGPCRRENPNVVRVYDRYNKDGFTVFSVSLDGLDSRTRQRYPEDQLENQMRSQKQRWVNAIKKDNLKWESHVSDLKKWESAAAATYGVSSIPRTFLLDRDGKIAAINPRRNLEEAVKNLL